MTTSEILRAAASKVRAGWTQQAFARDASGKELEWAENDKACQWCVTGAICSVPVDKREDCFKAFNALMLFLDRPDIEDWNDAPERTQSEVVAALEGAASE